MADNDGLLMTDALRAELGNITSTQRAAVLMLLLGEDQAAEIIKFLNPKEVQERIIIFRVRENLPKSKKIKYWGSNS